MKTVNYEVLTSMWTGLSMRYGNRPISTAEFKEACKMCHISLSNGLKNAYESVKIITCPCRGQVVIASSITREQIVRAYEEVRKTRKAYKEELDGVHAFNIAVKSRKDPDFSIDSCVKFLQNMGYFVCKPEKGEKIVRMPKGFEVITF